MLTGECVAGKVRFAHFSRHARSADAVMGEFSSLFFGLIRVCTPTCLPRR